MPRQLTNLRIDEVSSVDRGAGEGVRITLMKRHPDEQKKREDNAFKALELALGSIVGADKVGQAVKCFKQFHDFMNEPPKESDMSPEEMTKFVNDSVAKAVAEALKSAGVIKDDNCPPDEAEKAKKPAKPRNDNTVGNGDAPDETGGGDSAADKKARQALVKAFGEADAALIIKALGVADPAQAEIAKRDAVIIDLQKHVASLVEKTQKDDFAKRATTIGLRSEDGEMLRKAYNGDVASLRAMEEIIAKLNVQVEKGGLLNEIGSAGGGAANAYDQLMAKARDIRQKSVEGGKPLTEAAAFVKAMELNPDLAKQEKAEREAKINKLA